MNTNKTIAMLCEILEKIGNPCGDVADPAQVTLGSLGIDSLSTLEILMMVDELTGIEVPGENVGPSTTLGELAALIDG